jgi:putative transposase
MSQYRRAHVAGACYFFTVVAYRREPILCDDAIRHALREAVLSVREQRPFSIDAWVLLPDHLHCIWTLPAGDADYSARWNIIKRKVSIACANSYKHKGLLTRSRRRRRESTIWQRRFWEHQIRDEMDFTRHVDYIHYNPVKHGLCARVSGWRYSTFHRYVAAGVYPEDWCGIDQDADMSMAGE